MFYILEYTSICLPISAQYASQKSFQTSSAVTRPEILHCSNDEQINWHRSKEPQGPGQPG